MHRKRTDEERERERRNKWAQRERARGNLKATPDQAPPHRDKADAHPKPFVGPIDDPEIEWLVAFEIAMGRL